MRWDLESRKLNYSRSNGNGVGNDPQVSFEQELENLKTILSKPQTSKTTRFRNQVLLMMLGIAAVGGLFLVFYLFSFPVSS